MLPAQGFIEGQLNRGQEEITVNRITFLLYVVKVRNPRTSNIFMSR